MTREYIDLLFNLLRNNEMFLTFFAAPFHPGDQFRGEKCGKTGKNGEKKKGNSQE